MSTGIHANLASVRTVLGGLLIAQAIPFITTLITARIVAPSVLGEFATWFGLVLTGGVIVSARLELTLGLEPAGAKRTRALSVLVMTVMAGCVGLSLAVFVAWKLFGASSLSLLAYGVVLAASAGITAIVQAWQSWLISEGLYRHLSQVRIVQAVAIAVFQIGACAIDASGVSLAIGYFIGMACGAIFLIRSTSLSHPLFVSRSRRWRVTLSFWRRHRSFIQYSLPADMISIFSAQLPILLISMRFGTEASGFFSLAVRMVGAPISLMGAAVLDVFKREAADSFRMSGNCMIAYKRAMMILGAMSLAVIGVVPIVADSFFSVAFGETWGYSGHIALLLLPMFAAKLVASPLSYVFYIAGAQRIDLLWQCALCFITATSLSVLESFEHAVIAYSAACVGLYCIYAGISNNLASGRRT